MDIFQADMVFNSNKYRTLENLNVMNKKFAFTVVRKGRRKMDQGMVSKSINATTANASF